jgi:transposase
MHKHGIAYVSIRAAAARMRKAPSTLRLMLERGEAEGTVIATEAGHARQYVSVAWLEQWEQTQGAAPDAA